MADPVIVVSPAPVADGQNVTLDVSGFNNKLSATDNLLQELADKFDDHTHAYSEITSNTHSHNMSALTDFLAPNDNLTDLGAANKRWKDIYAGNAVIQTSDRNYKEDIEDIENPWAFIEALEPRQFKFKGGKRIHTGFIAQDVKKALRKDYAIYCEQNGVCGLRYEEAIAPMVWCIQDLADTDCSIYRELHETNLKIDVSSEAASAALDEVREEIKRIAVMQDAFKKDLDTLSEILEEGSSSVSLKEHRAVTDALISRISALETVKDDKPTNWVAWAAIGISIIAGLCHFL